MKKIVEYLKCGLIECPKTRKESRCVVYNFSDHLEKIIPFFIKYSLLSTKLLDFQDFKKVSNILKKEKILNPRSSPPRTALYPVQSPLVRTACGEASPATTTSRSRHATRRPSRGSTGHNANKTKSRSQKEQGRLSGFSDFDCPRRGS